MGRTPNTPLLRRPLRRCRSKRRQGMAGAQRGHGGGGPAPGDGARVQWLDTGWWQVNHGSRAECCCTAAGRRWVRTTSQVLPQTFTACCCPPVCPPPLSRERAATILCPRQRHGNNHTTMMMASPLLCWTLVTTQRQQGRTQRQGRPQQGQRGLPWFCLLWWGRVLKHVYLVDGVTAAAEALSLPLTVAQHEVLPSISLTGRRLRFEAHAVMRREVTLVQLLDWVVTTGILALPLAVARCGSRGGGGRNRGPRGGDGDLSLVTVHLS